MQIPYRISAIAVAFSCLTGCTLPNFVSAPDNKNIAPSGPKVADLIANLKCEMWEAAHDENVLPYYEDTPSLTVRDFSKAPPDRQFTLENLFREIDFVAEAQFTLDVTGAAAFNPSIGYVMPTKQSSFNLTLSIGAQLSDTAHRNLILYSSVEGERLVASPKSPLFDRNFIEVEPAEPSILARDPTNGAVPCGNGEELQGRLGLKEVLATSIIAERMNDVAVYQDTTGTGTVNGVAAPSQFSNYAFGEISTQVDFTIVEGGNGGPNWKLEHFTGPGGGTSGLFNASRQVKDTLIVTFLPVCIRQEYFPKEWDPDFHGVPHQLPKPTNTDVSQRTDITRTAGAGQKQQSHEDKHSTISTVVTGDLGKRPPPPAVTYPAKYEPEMVVGTPGWANYLPPCGSPQGVQARAAATAQARTNNLSVQGLGILQQLQQVPPLQ